MEFEEAAEDYVFIFDRNWVGDSSDEQKTAFSCVPLTIFRKQVIRSTNNEWSHQGSKFFKLRLTGSLHCIRGISVSSSYNSILEVLSEVAL